MKFRTSRKLKNMILSINLAILTFFFFFLSNFPIHFRVGRYENLFKFFFWKAIGSAQKTGSVGLAETQVFFRPNQSSLHILACRYWWVIPLLFFRVTNIRIKMHSKNKNTIGAKFRGLKGLIIALFLLPKTFAVKCRTRQNALGSFYNQSIKLILKYIF